MSAWLRRWLAALSPYCYCGDPLYCCGICPKHPEFGRASVATDTEDTAP